MSGIPDDADRPVSVEVFTVKVQRHLAPTAAPLSVADVMRGILGLMRPGRARSRVESELRTYFGVRHVFLFSSGKAALASILAGLKAGSSRRQVIIPAYTCYSVPSAVHKAGLDVMLCDVDARTLDYNMSDLRTTVNAHTLAVIAPHPLGHPADITGIMDIAKSVGAVVIEDAAQAMGGRHNGRLLGTQGDAGIFSLGRGKNVSVGSGGIAVTNSDEVAEALERVYQTLSAESVFESIANAMTVTATKMLLHPLLYWLPAGLPFLGLGETKYDPDFQINSMDGLRAGLLASWRKRLEESNTCRIEKKHLYESELSQQVEMPIAGQSSPSAYLRLPVLMRSDQVKADICRLSAEQGLGISAMYPEPVSQIPALQSEIRLKEFAGAKVLAARLVTLPLHRYVTKADTDRIARVVNRFADRDSQSLSPACEATPVGLK
jgi:dTDP-4-amino-4,6-dideoxygalactose transaminase